MNCIVFDGEQVDNKALEMAETSNIGDGAFEKLDTQSKMEALYALIVHVLDIGNSDIKMSIAKEKILPIDFYRRLLNDEDSKVVCTVIENEDVPIELIEEHIGKLLKIKPKQYPYKYFLSSPFKTMSEYDADKELWLKEDVVGILLKRNNITPNILDRLARKGIALADVAKHGNTSDETKEYLAEEATTPPEVLDILVRCGNEKVRDRIALRDDALLDTYKYLARVAI